jgi:hypothetical protein
MAETINGTVGVVWGIGVTGLTGSGISTFAPQSLQFSAESDEAETRNGKGQVVTDVFYNQRHTVTIEVIPTGSTIAAARTNNVIPAPGTIITIVESSAEDAELTGTNSAKYICVRASKSKSNTGATSISMELKQYVENDVAVAVAAS